MVKANHALSNSAQVETGCVNTDFWLDKITRELRHLLQNKFALGR